MKFFYFLVVLFCAISVVFSLRCYLCTSSKRADGTEQTCELKPVTCDNRIYRNGTSCATITFDLYGYTAVHKNCYYKMSEPTGMLSFGGFGFTAPASYKTCDEDLCNASENINNKFNVIAITSVLFSISRLF